MIKINLLGEGRPKVSKPRKTSVGSSMSGEPANVLLMVFLALGVLVIGGRYFMLQSTINTKKAEIAEAQKEVDELLPIIKEVEQFEARTAELQHKIEVINTLKTNQRGPVNIMDQISRAMPEMLWLNRMQTRGNLVTLNGQAFNTNAVANFIDNLDQVEAFNEPVLKDTAKRRNSGTNEVFNFVVNFTFNPTAVKANPQPEASAEAAG